MKVKYSNHSEKFNCKIDELNQTACAFIEEEKYEQAAIYLD